MACLWAEIFKKGLSLSKIGGGAPAPPGSATAILGICIGSSIYIAIHRTVYPYLKATTNSYIYTYIYIYICPYIIHVAYIIIPFPQKGNGILFLCGFIFAIIIVAVVVVKLGQISIFS